MREHAWLARLPDAIGPRTADVRLGIGDDAAVLDHGSEKLVWTIDAQVEGVHFTRELASLEDVGFRAVMAAASDVAAMGGRVKALLSSLVVPSWIDEAGLDAIVRGERAATEVLGAPIVGGNVSRGAELSLTISVLGEASDPVPRGGAREGDHVWLLGPVGQAGAGLAWLRRHLPPPSPSIAVAVKAWRRPEARIAGGLAAAARATSGIDVSDGLAQDTGHLARASGLTFELDADACLAAGGAPLADTARALGTDPLSFALAGGEDYALVFTSPHNLTEAGFTRIGVVHAGPPEVVVSRAGVRIPIPPGWDHSLDSPD